MNKDNNGKIIDHQIANGKRIKQMSVHNNLLITLMSCGALAIWRFMRKSCKLKYIKSTNIGCRPICMKIVDASERFPMPMQISANNDEIKTEESNENENCNNPSAITTTVKKRMKNRDKTYQNTRNFKEKKV